MNNQEIASFPLNKSNYLHKRGSYDQIMAAGGVEHNYNHCLIFCWQCIVMNHNNVTNLTVTDRADV
jgi:hypothetical protein